MGCVRGDGSATETAGSPPTSDEDDDEVARERVVQLVGGLGRRARHNDGERRAAERTEPVKEGEFNLKPSPSSSAAGGARAAMAAMLGALSDDTGFAGLRKQVRRKAASGRAGVGVGGAGGHAGAEVEEGQADKASPRLPNVLQMATLQAPTAAVLPTPLPTRFQERAERKAAAELTKGELDKWAPIVQANRKVALRSWSPVDIVRTAGRCSRSSARGVHVRRRTT